MVVGMLFSDFIESGSFSNTFDKNSEKWVGRARKVIEKAGIEDKEVEDTDARKKLEMTSTWNWLAGILSPYYLAYYDVRHWEGVVGVLALAYFIDSYFFGSSYNSIIALSSIVVFGTYGNSWVILRKLKASQGEKPRIKSRAARVAVSIGVIVAAGVIPAFMGPAAAEDFGGITTQSQNASSQIEGNSTQVSSAESQILTDVSGVWVNDNNNSVIKISLLGNNKFLNVDGEKIPVVEQKFHLDMDLVTVGLDTNDDLPTYWSIQQDFNRDGSFTLNLFFQDGTQTTLSFVRAL